MFVRTGLLIAVTMSALASSTVPQASSAATPHYTYPCNQLIASYSVPGLPVYSDSKEALSHLARPPGRCVDGAKHNTCVGTVMMSGDSDTGRTSWRTGPWLPQTCVVCGRGKDIDTFEFIPCGQPDAIPLAQLTPEVLAPAAQPRP